MKKTLIVSLIVVLVGCRAEEKKEPESKTASAQTSTPAPFAATYSSSFEMGDSKHSEAILAVWKAWDDGDLGASKKFFADTMRFYLRDGYAMTGPVDSIIKGSQEFRNTLSSVKSTVHAYFPVKSTDKNENWVCIWGTEVSTDKQGKTDSVGLQETWRFDKNGKVDLLYQFARKLPPTMPK